LAEGAKDNPSFPVADSTLRVVLPTGNDPITNQPVRGPDGLRPGLIVFPRTEVDQGSPDADSDKRWQPIACIAVAQCSPPGNPGADVVLVDALDRVSFWLLDVVYDGTGSRPALPPQITFEVRAAIAGAGGTAFVGGGIILSSWEDAGLIVQVSGILCSQWELWMRIPLPITEPAGTKVRLRIGCIADRVGGGVFETQLGTIAS
jgi:hypothetical protein